MGTIPTPPTLVAGAVLTAAQLNTMRDCINFWALTPRCKVLQSAAQSIPNNVYTTLAWNSEAFDVVQSGDTPMHDNATTNTTVYIRTAGKYNIAALTSFAINATGERKVYIAKNGTAITEGSQPASSGVATTVGAGPVLVACSVGDAITVDCLQTSGAALNTNAPLCYLYVSLDSQ